MVALAAILLGMVPVAFAQFGASPAAAQGVCYDGQGNVVPCPTVATTAPPNTLPPPTLPPATTSPPQTSPPPTSPPATQPPVTALTTPPRTNRSTGTQLVVPSTAAPTTTVPAPTTTAPAATTTSAAATTTLAPTTTTVRALAVEPLSKVDPPHSSHRALTLAIIAIVAMLLVLAILGPELRAWFDRNHPRAI